MKRKLISIFLVIILLQYFYSFVFAENITNEETANEQKNLNEMQQEVAEQIMLGQIIAKFKIMTYLKNQN